MLSSITRSEGFAAGSDRLIGKFSEAEWRSSGKQSQNVIAMTKLDLRNPEEAEEVSKTVSNVPVKELQMINCAVTSDALRLILTNMETSYLQRLKFEALPLTLPDVKSISYILCETLLELTLNDCMLTDEAVKTLTKGISKRGEQLQALHLERNRITDHGIFLLTSAVQVSTIRELSLSGNQLTDAGLGYLGNALSHCRLETLYLDGHPRITAKGIAGLAQNLQGTWLAILSLNGCPGIGNEGVELLVKACCSKSSNILILNLNSCGLTDHVAGVIGDAIAHQDWSVARFRLAGNNFSESARNALHRTSWNDELEELDLGDREQQVTSLQAHDSEIEMKESS